MKKIVVIIILLAGYTNQVNAQCKAKQAVKECRPSMAPFTYDSYALNDIVYDAKKPNTVEVEFTAFAGQKYKLVFCTSGLEQQVKLNIYDKNIKFKKRNKVYDSENGIEGRWAFEPSKSGTFYIDYEIPAVAVNKKGCVVMLIGYKE